MKSIVKVFGVSSCCLLIGAASAMAEPTVLADVELDHVTAGDSQPTRLVTGRLGWGLLVPPGEVNCLAIGCPGSPPGGPVPTEPPGCETGACKPGLRPFPGWAPIIPVDLRSIERFTPFWRPSPDKYCSPACDPGPVDFVHSD